MTKETKRLCERYAKQYHYPMDWIIVLFKNFRDFHRIEEILKQYSRPELKTLIGRYQDLMYVDGELI